MHQENSYQNYLKKTNDYAELLLNISYIDENGVVYKLIEEIDEGYFNIEKNRTDRDNWMAVSVL